MSIKKPSLQDLVRQIVAVNHAWKASRSLYGSHASVVKATKLSKSRLQVRLLKLYAPDEAYLILDQDAPTDEQDEIDQDSLWSVRLEHPVILNFNGKDKEKWDGEHLPVRVLDQWMERGLLSSKEIKSWQRS